ncbi:hypothetical protein J7T55_012954 [Diaporthe amygdali]|uniref:uncharacterized protein n=1 Tax=Phomopsis amygdali TaxID=1214568 RepID=UPI0022FE05CC|nr:uncharacterized protein J7T55_012954 [Diaporthe amygdali]KAJ0118700.1 hypothetical protein J7T55_012954 [Diaporthe amygdali]
MTTPTEPGANPGHNQVPTHQDLDPAQHHDQVQRLGVPAPTAKPSAGRRLSAASDISVSNISTTSSGNEKWLSPLDRLSLQPVENAAIPTGGAGQAMMDDDGVDLSSLKAGATDRRPGPGPEQPLYHQQNASSTRMPFHGDESFPGTPQLYTPEPYSGQYAGPQRDSQAELLLDSQRNRHSARSVSFGPSTTFMYPGQGKEPPNRSSSLRPRTCRPMWHSSLGMYVCFIFGLLCAVGHHIFYASLDGEPAESQTEMLRYGTFLAYAAKAGFSAAAISAFKQRIWVTVRSRFMSISALDSMFAAAEDMAALINWEFLKDAKAAFALVFFAWTTPLVVILTANTLLVEPRTIVNNTTCASVRTLNFTFEDLNDWRKPKQIDGLFEIPVSIWNTTKRDDQTDDDWFDYYTGPSPNFQQTATLGAFLQEVVARKNASYEVCGSGWNCTFNIEFTAPGYNCTEVASGVNSTPANLTQESGQAEAPFGTDFLLPQGKHSYYAYATGGEYSTTQLKNVGVSGIPNIPNSELPAHFGALRVEPILWIGYVVLNSPGEVQPNRSDPGWQDAFTPKIFACEHRETDYIATFNYTDGSQSAAISSRKFGAPIINTTFIPSIEANDGTDDNITAIPEENYIYPNDTARYRRVAAYHSLGYMLRNFINGTVEVEDTLINPIQNTEAIQTKLLDPRNNYFPYSNLMPMVQGLYEDLILSMFSNPQFVEVVWAARPSEQSGTLLDGGVPASSGTPTGTGDESDYKYNCTKTRTANAYAYHKRDLWIVYGIAVVLTLICVTVGGLAIRENGGVTRNTRFSSIVAATRGPALEKVAWMGPLQDRGDVPKDVKSLRLGYGIMNESKLGLGAWSPPPEIGPDPNLVGVEGEGFNERMVSEERSSSGYFRRRRAFSTDMRCGFGLKGDVDQRHGEGSLFHR